MLAKPGKTQSNRRALSWLAPVLVVAAAASATAQDTKPVSPDLTPMLQDLLRKEMLSIEVASKDILSAMIAGDHASVAGLAQNIHDSFILEQSMTPQDRKDLMAAVPEGFLTRDDALHEISAALAEAGRDGDRAAQHQEFGRMIEACSACHALYATDRFPMLAE